MTRQARGPQTSMIFRGHRRTECPVKFSIGRIRVFNSPPSRSAPLLSSSFLPSTANPTPYRHRCPFRSSFHPHTLLVTALRLFTSPFRSHVITYQRNVIESLAATVQDRQRTNFYLAAGGREDATEFFERLGFGFCYGEARRCLRLVPTFGWLLARVYVLCAAHEQSVCRNAFCLLFWLVTRECIDERGIIRKSDGGRCNLKLILCSRMSMEWCFDIGHRKLLMDYLIIRAMRDCWVVLLRFGV